MNDDAGRHGIAAEDATSGSEAAFATLVSRHINLVHAVAMRQTGNPQHAEEITQAVFIILARKAGALKSGTVLSGWLFHTARLTAANFVRTEIGGRTANRRLTCNPLCRKQAATRRGGGSRRLLDQAVADLGERIATPSCRDLSKGRNWRKGGNGLGSERSGGAKRVNRAVEKLSKFFTKRGVMLSGTILARHRSQRRARCPGGTGDIGRGAGRR